MVFGGFGPAFLNANNSKIVSRYYSPEKIGNAIGIIMMGSTVGMTVATATSAMFPTLTTAFIVAAIIQVIVLGSWLIFTKGYDQGETEEVQKGVPLKDSLSTVLKCRYTWIIGLCLTCILGCNTALSGFTPLALQSKGFSDTTAGMLASGLMIGNFIGTFLGPRIISKMPGKRIALIICAVVAAISAAVGWLIPGYLVFGALLICGFGLGAMMPVLLSMPIQLPEIGPAYAGTAGGVVGTLELLGAVIIPTYIITPLAGGNYYIFFGLAGAVMIVMVLIALMIPEV